MNKRTIYYFLTVALFFLSCIQPNPKVNKEKIISSTSSLPKIDLGNPERYVTLEIAMEHAAKPRFRFTDLAFDKSKGLLLMKDDGIATDYTIVYKILNGGMVNGKTYPGFSFDDGTGKQISYKYSFAINTNDEHTTAPHLTTWAQMMEMISKGHSVMNHSLFHGGTDKLKAIKDAEKNMWQHTHYRMTELVPPANEEGFVETGLYLGYHLISSEFGAPAPDGNNDKGNENISWGSFIRTTTQNFNKVLASRTNLGDQWNTNELQNAKGYIDYIFNNPEKHKKLVGTAFSHGPFADHKESAENFNQLMTYIKNHPFNKDSVWVTSSKELMDYINTKKQVIIQTEDYNVKTKIYLIVIDMDKVSPNVIWRNLSLKISGGKITNVKANGVQEVSFNSKTGLINLYKLDRSKVKDPFKDPLPPQITSVTAKANIVNIVFDKPVTQKKHQAYEISGNTVLSLQGSNKNWQLILKDPAATGQLFYYRMQKGDAAQQGLPSMKVCTYAGLPLKL